MSKATQASFLAYVDVLCDDITEELDDNIKSNTDDADKVSADARERSHASTHSVDQSTDVDGTTSNTQQSDANGNLKQLQIKNTLCGYLNKRRLGAKLNQYKKRWFRFNDSTCQLLYYKTESDVRPLGQIDISCAALVPDLESERKHVFKISSSTASYVLQAPSEQSMLHWLEELQKKRKAYSKMKKYFIKDSLTSKSVQQPEKGLVKADAKTLEDSNSVISESFCTSADTGSDTGAVNEADNNSLLNFVLYGDGTTERKDHSIEDSISGSLTSLCTSTMKPSGDSSTKDQPFHHLASLRRKFSKKHVTSCSHCEQSDNRLTTAKELISSLIEDIDAKDRVIASLKNHISTIMSGLQKSDTSDYESFESNGNDVPKERKEMNSDREGDFVEQLQKELASCKDTISLYKEILQVKDSVVESLTRRLDELEASQGSENRASSEDMMKLQDTYDAYRKQNTVLNQEILELNVLREQDRMREHALQVNYANLEADYYCLKSKYLVCLRELDRPRLEYNKENDNLSQETISSLLQEAMNCEVKTQLDRPNIQEQQKYDKYGFCLIPLEARNNIQSQADSLLRKSDELSARLNSMEVELSTHVKWENFMQRQGERPLARNQELKQLIRLGIPYEYREKIWNFCINYHVKRMRAMFGECYYSKLVRKSTLSIVLNPAATQIELDLLRTLPDNRYYERLSSDGIPKLRNVLLAYSLHRPEVGYCQGLNRLAAIALLFLEEADAFWCLVAITEYIMPKEYYTSDIIAALVDQRVLKDLIADKVPRVHAAVEHHQVDLALFAFNWFMTIFVDNIPVETYLRIWDTFLFEGSKVLFRFAVAFFLYREEEIIKAATDRIQLSNCLRSTGQYITDVHKVTQIAFGNINPFPLKYITRRRNYHYDFVRAELGVMQEDWENSQIQEAAAECHSSPLSQKNCKEESMDA